MVVGVVAVLVLKVSLVVPHVLHCCAALKTLDSPIIVDHDVASCINKFRNKIVVKFTRTALAFKNNKYKIIWPLSQAGNFLLNSFDGDKHNNN